MRIDRKHFADLYLSQYIDPVAQYENFPSYVINGWVYWLYERWENGLINIAEYRKLLNTDIEKYIEGRL